MLTEKQKNKLGEKIASTKSELESLIATFKKEKEICKNICESSGSKWTEDSSTESLDFLSLNIRKLSSDIIFYDSILNEIVDIDFEISSLERGILHAKAYVKQLEKEVEEAKEETSQFERRMERMIFVKNLLI